MTLRESLKERLQATLARLGPAALAARRRGPRDVILAYHNVVTDPAQAGADRSLHIPLAQFAAHLDLLEETADLVPLQDILRGAGERRRPLRVAVTFDDAYAGALEVGVGELVSRGVPATIFVTPGILDGRDFWWDRFPGLPADPGRRDTLLRVNGGVDEAATRSLEQLGWERIHPPRLARSADAAALDAAVVSGLIALGAHSWSHPNLAAIPEADLVGELERPLAWLRDRYPAASRPWLAYPYGLHSERVHTLAAEAGYEFGLTVTGGFVSAETAAFAVPRLNVPAGLSADGLRLRLSGLVPMDA